MDISGTAQSVTSIQMSSGIQPSSQHSSKENFIKFVNSVIIYSNSVLRTR